MTDEIEVPRWRSRFEALGPGGIKDGLDPVQEVAVAAAARQLSDADLEDEFEHARIAGMSTRRQFRAARRLRHILSEEYVRRGHPRPQQSVGPIRGRRLAGNMPNIPEGELQRVENDDPTI